MSAPLTRVEVVEMLAHAPDGSDVARLATDLIQARDRGRSCGVKGCHEWATCAGNVGPWRGSERPYQGRCAAHRADLDPHTIGAA